MAALPNVTKQAWYEAAPWGWVHTAAMNMVSVHWALAVQMFWTTVNSCHWNECKFEFWWKFVVWLRRYNFNQKYIYFNESCSRSSDTSCGRDGLSLEKVLELFWGDCCAILHILSPIDLSWRRCCRRFWNLGNGSFWRQNKTWDMHDFSWTQLL